MKTNSQLRSILRSRTFLLQAALLGVLLSSPPFLAVGSAQQGKAKSVKLAFAINPKVRLKNLKVGSQQHDFGEEFEETADWPRKLSLQVENISTDPIVYLGLDLTFPDTRASGNLMMYPINLGIRPRLTSPSNAKPLRLMPGETLEVTLNEHYGHLEQFIKTRHPIDQIHLIEIRTGFIIFEDGIGWDGEFFIPDPYNPRRYIPVGQRRPK